MSKAGSDLWKEVEEAQRTVLRAEVDESLIRTNLLLQPAERLRQHDRALPVVRALQDASDRNSNRES